MPAWMATSLLVIARLTGMVCIIPGLNLGVVPVRTRALLVLLLALPVLCVTPVNAAIPAAQPADLAFDILHELIVGFTLGLPPAAMIWGLRVATRAVSGMTGLPGGDGDADGLSTDSALQHLLTITALSIFFLSSGHRHVVQAVLLSFDWLPAGQHAPLESARDLLSDLLTRSFEFGVRAIAPIAMSLALSMMVLAAINRIVPQLGYFAVGMSLQTLVLLGALVLFVGGVGWFLDSEFPAAIERASDGWQLLLSRSSP